MCNICYRYFSSIALYLHLFVILEEGTGEKCQVLEESHLVGVENVVGVEWLWSGEDYEAR